MAGCCDPRGCDAMFTPRFAHHAARRYRRRGPDRVARRMVGFLVSEGLEGLSVLEIGGGVGEVHLELLRHGAARATNLELSAAYEDDAAELVAERGLGDRVERRLVDIAAQPASVEPADVVVLHRVVCCYPDAPALLTAAADHTRRLLVFSYPRASAVTRSVLAVQNAAQAVRGRQFRAFAHPPDAMLGTLAHRGLPVVFTHRGPVWQVAGTRRAGA